MNDLGGKDRKRGIGYWPRFGQYVILLGIGLGMSFIFLLSCSMPGDYQREQQQVAIRGGKGRDAPATALRGKRF